MILCGTGHRPDKLGGYGQDVHERLVTLAENWLGGFPKDVDVVISGMALGWDQALAQAAINLGIRTKAYIPFIGMESKWPASSQKYYHELLRNIDEDDWIICSDGGYAPYKMQVRNERMVDASNLVLALWNGTSGGTANCVAYASRKAVEIVNLWDEYEELRTNPAG